MNIDVLKNLERELAKHNSRIYGMDEMAFIIEDLQKSIEAMKKYQELNN